MKAIKASCALALSGAMLLSLSGCGGNAFVDTVLEPALDRESTTELADDDYDYDEEDYDYDEDGIEAEAEDLSDQVTIDDEYWHSGYGHTTHAIIFTNQTDKTVGVSSNSEALDKDGEVIATGNSVVDGIGPKSTGVLIEYVSVGKKAVGFNTSLFATPDIYDEALQNLDTTVSVKGDKAIVKVTNNDESTADHVKVSVLYFEDGEFVTAENDDLAPSGGGLKAGKSISQDFDLFNETFDSVKVYTNGYS